MADINPIKILELPIKGEITEDMLRDWVPVTEPVAKSTARQTVRRPYPQGDGDIDDGSGVIAGAIIVTEDGTISLRIDRTKLDITEDGYLTLGGDLATYYDGDGIEIKPKTVPNPDDPDGPDIVVPGQSTINVRSGKGIRIIDSKVSVKGDATHGIDVTDNGVAIKTGDGIMFGSDGTVMVKDAVGIVVDEDGVSVATADNGGVAFDDDGNLKLDFTDNTTNPGDGKVWSAKQTKEYVDAKESSASGGDFYGAALFTLTPKLQFLNFTKIHSANCSFDGTTIKMGTETFCRSCTVNMMFDFEFPTYEDNAVILEVTINDMLYNVDTTKKKSTLTITNIVAPDTFGELIPISVKVNVKPEDAGLFPETNACECRISVAAN